MSDLEAWSKSIRALDRRCTQVHQRFSVVASLKYRVEMGYCTPRIGKQAAMVRLTVLVEHLRGEYRALRLAGKALHRAYMWNF
jgi:hypothetical protein